MNTPSALLSPADLASPPDLKASRPLCRCGTLPAFPRVGMHGDGVTVRVVPWPVLDGDALVVRWVRVVGRRYWCPTCATTVRVAHPGLRHGSTFGAAMIAALLHIIAPAAVGGGGADDARAHQLVHGRPLPPSERARTGRPRWSSLRRWARELEALWPDLVLPATRRTARLGALLAAFGLGRPLREVLDVAVHAHARGGRAM